MKKIITLALALCVCAGGYAKPTKEKKNKKQNTEETGGFIFTDVKVVPTTSVKDQNKSGTCWCFSGNSFLEDEILRQKGDTIDLSEMYVVRQCYRDKAERFIRLYGQTNFGPGGSVMDVPYVWERYGAVPESVYSGLGYGEEKHSHGELDAALSSYLNAVIRKPDGRLSTSWRKGVDAILDAYLGEVPEEFEIDGVKYTPRSYADSLNLNMSDYVPVTSFSHHPYYSTFAVEVPDNWLWAHYYNVPLEDMEAIVDNALDNGYSIAWAADVSEGGFNWYKGYAVMPKPIDSSSLEGTELARWVTLSDKDRKARQYDINGPAEEMVVTQEVRQDMFDRQETTDDHGMVIVGYATDQKGNKYYKVKNSWDDNQVYRGYFYVSLPYFRAKTIDILVNRDGIPEDIAQKMALK